MFAWKRFTSIISICLTLCPVLALAQDGCTGETFEIFESCVSSRRDACSAESNFACVAGDVDISLKEIARNALSRCNKRICRSKVECDVFDDSDKRTLEKCANSQINLIKKRGVFFLFDVGRGALVSDLKSVVAALIAEGVSTSCRCPV